MEGFIAALEASWLGVAMRDHPYLYPVVNVTHLLGLVLIVGGAGLLDLRLLGVARQVPLPIVYGLLTGAAAIGIVIQIASGIPLFASDATSLIENSTFSLKMLLFAMALTNALVFRLLWRGRIADWDRHPPMLGLVQAALSLMLWLSIGALGRWIAYA